MRKIDYNDAKDWLLVYCKPKLPCKNKKMADTASGLPARVKPDPNLINFSPSLQIFLINIPQQFSSSMHQHVLNVSHKQFFKNVKCSFLNTSFSL